MLLCLGPSALFFWGELPTGTVQCHAHFGVGLSSWPWHRRRVLAERRPLGLVFRRYPTEFFFVAQAVCWFWRHPTT